MPRCKKHSYLTERLTVHLQLTSLNCPIKLVRQRVIGYLLDLDLVPAVRLGTLGISEIVAFCSRDPVPEGEQSSLRRSRIFFTAVSVAVLTFYRVE